MESVSKSRYSDIVNSGRSRSPVNLITVLDCFSCQQATLVPTFWIKRRDMSELEQLPYLTISVLINRSN